MFDARKYYQKADAIKAQFDQARKELAEYAATQEGREALDRVDPTAARKLLHFPGDISPARLLTLAIRLMDRV